MKYGFELSNRPDGTITPEEWQRWDALGGTVAKCRPYSLNVANLNYLKAGGVDTVILRPTSDGDIDVEARVNDLQPAIVQLLQWDFGTVICQVDNEGNLRNDEHPSGKPCPPDYWQKVSQVIAHPAMVGLRGERVKLASPPLAVAQREPEWLEAGADVLPAFDFLSVHLYDEGDPVLVPYTLGLFTPFGLPLIADEVGCSGHAGEEEKARRVADYLRIAAEAGVEMATIFHLGGSDEWAGFRFSPDVIRRCIRPTLERLDLPTHL